MTSSILFFCCPGSHGEHAQCPFCLAELQASRGVKVPQSMVKKKVRKIKKSLPHLQVVLRRLR